MAITRRQLLKRGAVSAAALALEPRLRWLPGTRVAWASGPPGATFVFLEFYGGNDGINTVYPISGAERTKYEGFRPTLQLPKTAADAAARATAAGFGSPTVLDIGVNANGSRYALHPAMTALYGLYTSGRAAVLNGVHYPFADHSHFRSEVIWYTADPLGTGNLGWFGKYLDSAGFQPTDIPAVIMGDGLSPLFTPTHTSLFAINSLSELQFPVNGDDGALKQTILNQLYSESAGRDAGLYPEITTIGSSGSATLANMANYYKAGSGVANAGKVQALLLDGDGNYDPGNPFVYDSPLNPDNPAVANIDLAQDLKHVAAMIRANVGARFFHVSIGGFDTHSNQEDGFYHSDLLRQVSESVAAFMGELGQSVTLPGGYAGYQTGDLSSDVLLLTFSEFGRTVRQNSPGATAAGTDHATCMPLFVVGGAVQGNQQFGAYPILDQLADVVNANEDDLVMTYDFRDVFGTILSRWLNVPLAAVGPGPGAILPVTNPGTPDPFAPNYTAFTPIPFLL
jgi:uncharacterized protein (DUF1501 family)